MGAENTRDIALELPPTEARGLVEAAGNAVPKFKPNGDLSWRKGWGLSNPVTVHVQLVPDGQGGTTVSYKASILALFDPFGFTTETLDVFEHQLQAHRAVRGTDATPEPALPLRRGLYVFGGSLALFLGVPMVLACCGGLLSVLSSF